MKLWHPVPAQHASRDISVDYLRALATVLVLVIHTSAPYSRLAERAQPALWQSPVPIVDPAHSVLLSYSLSFLDVSTMSLMFFISGIFTFPGLRKKGSLAFLRDRAVRLGLPFLAITLLWMPLAYFAPWGLEHPGGSLGRFLLVNAQWRFSSGPGWFLWLLLFFDVVMAVLYVLVGGIMFRLAAWLRAVCRSPWLWGWLMVLAGIVLYLPPALRYAGGWLPFVSPPLMLQPSRTLFYAAWFVAGCIAGGAGLEQGLLARGERLARGWKVWVLVGFGAGNVLWFGTKMAGALPPFKQAIVDDLLWVVADVGICFGLLALFRGCVHQRRPWADSLVRHAYAIYALHYVFVLWIERWLLPLRWPALAKFSLVFAGTLALSWAAATVWLQLRFSLVSRLKRQQAEIAGSQIGASAPLDAAAFLPGVNERKAERRA